MTAGETKNVQIKIKSNSAYVKTGLQSTMSYFYKSGVVQDITNKKVFINEDGFKNSTVQIFEGSTITWINNDTIPHTVTGMFADQTINASLNFTHTFGTQGNFSYFDQFTGFTGQVQVLDIDQVELIHDPALDKKFKFNITSILVETDLLVTILESNNFTIPYNGKKEGVIKIDNVGTKTAKGIRFKANWTLFNKQDFELNASTTTYVTFTITPAIVNVNDTNKNYVLPINVTTNNTAPVTSLEFNVFVPQATNISIVEDDAAAFFQEKKEFCTAFPTSPFCITEPVIKEVNQTVYKSPPLPYNYTQEDVNRLNRNYLVMKEELRVISNFIQSEFFGLKNTVNDSAAAVSSLEGDVRSVRSKQSELLNEEEENERTIRFILTFAVITILIGGLVLLSLVFFKQYFLAKRLRGV